MINLIFLADSQLYFLSETYITNLPLQNIYGESNENKLHEIGEKNLNISKDMQRTWKRKHMQWLCTHSRSDYIDVKMNSEMDEMT